MCKDESYSPPLHKYILFIWDLGEMGEEQHYFTLDSNQHYLQTYSRKSLYTKRLTIKSNS